jgi:dTDP-4-amino-4,6-dideoxygalactose transaminase
MTEVSDFSQNMSKQGPASREQLTATAAWQAAMGVTEFTLYYNRAARPPADYRAYCNFVGRLNALLREANPQPSVLLYYPIYDVWGEFLPVAEKLCREVLSLPVYPELTEGQIEYVGKTVLKFYGLD